MPMDKYAIIGWTVFGLVGVVMLTIIITISVVVSQEQETARIQTCIEAGMQWVAGNCLPR